MEVAFSFYKEKLMSDWISGSCQECLLAWHLSPFFIYFLKYCIPHFLSTCIAFSTLFLYILVFCGSPWTRLWSLLIDLQLIYLSFFMLSSIYNVAFYFSSPNDEQFLWAMDLYPHVAFVIVTLMEFIKFERAW